LFHSVLIPFQDMLIRLKSLILVMSGCYSKLANRGDIAVPCSTARQIRYVTMGLSNVKRYIKF